MCHALPPSTSDLWPVNGVKRDSWYSPLYPYCLRQLPLRLILYTYMTTSESTNQTCHMPQATAEDVVRSSRPMDDGHLSRSLLDTGIVDERQTYVWPELCESAHTSMRHQLFPIARGVLGILLNQSQSVTLLLFPLRTVSEPVHGAQFFRDLRRGSGQRVGHRQHGIDR